MLCMSCLMLVLVSVDGMWCMISCLGFDCDILKFSVVKCGVVLLVVLVLCWSIVSVSGISSSREGTVLVVCVRPRCLQATCLRVVRTLISIRLCVPLVSMQTFPNRVSVQLSSGVLMLLFVLVIVAGVGLSVVLVSVMLVLGSLKLHSVATVLIGLGRCTLVRSGGCDVVV